MEDQDNVITKNGDIEKEEIGAEGIGEGNIRKREFGEGDILDSNIWGFNIFDYDILDHDVNSNGLLPLPGWKISRIRKWLKPTDYLSESHYYKRRLLSHLAKNRDCIQTTDEYQKWYHSQEIGSLWIEAAGKHAAGALLAAKLSDSGHDPVLYFFCPKTGPTPTPQN